MRKQITNLKFAKDFVKKSLADFNKNIIYDQQMEKKIYVPTYVDEAEGIVWQYYYRNIAINGHRNCCNPRCLSSWTVLRYIRSDCGVYVQYS